MEGTTLKYINVIHKHRDKMTSKICSPTWFGIFGSHNFVYNHDKALSKRVCLKCGLFQREQSEDYVSWYDTIYWDRESQVIVDQPYLLVKKWKEERAAEPPPKKTVYKRISWEDV